MSWDFFFRSFETVKYVFIFCQFSSDRDWTIESPTKKEKQFKGNN